MTEIGWVILMVIAAAIVLMAIAGWLLAMTMVRFAWRAERWFAEIMNRTSVLPEPRRDKPPDGSGHPQARAEQYVAPMVRRARARMEARMR